MDESGVGIVLNSKMKEELVVVERKSSRLMRIKIMLSQEAINVVSAYMPHRLEVMMQRRKDFGGKCMK